jgi:outer membrane protein OmpA-like peptidoglycan-associated protein
VLALLGDRVRKEGLGASALASLLGGQRDSITRAIPGALAGLFGQGAPRAAEPRYESRPAARAVEPERRSGLRWLLPFAVGLALLAGLWSLLRGGDDRESRVAARPPEPAKVTMTAPKVAAPPPPAASVLRYALPNGVQIAIPQTGFENQLVGYLTDTSLPIGDDTWFNFDRLLFETDSASLKSESREQISVVAEILKAYPSVRVKIGGYTDSTGDAAHNVELSRARANSVRSELVALGIGGERIEGEGYGQEYPVASNDTEAGRAQNRRIALRVTAR